MDYTVPEWFLSHYIFVLIRRYGRFRGDPLPPLTARARARAAAASYVSISTSLRFLLRMGLGTSRVCSLQSPHLLIF